VRVEIGEGKRSSIWVLVEVALWRLETGCGLAGVPACRSQEVL
jgi:hypothetical protein